MRIISFMQYNILPNDNNKKKVRAFIVSDSLPSGFPDSDSIITETFPDYTFDTMSVLQVLSPAEDAPSIYVVKEDGTWTSVDGSVSYIV